MRQMSKTLCAVMAATFAAGAAVPAVAAPAMARSAPAIDGGNVVNVQSQRQERRFDRRQDRRENRFERRQDRREARFERRNGNPYYNGRRGYRDKRPGYRQYNGFWFPAAAFITGAIVGGAVSGGTSTTVVVPRGSAHVDWCQNRYRSYRVSDNSFQPYNGPRQACVSPYR